MLPRILVVDDEPSVRSVLERLLSRWGFEVASAGTLGSARDSMRTQPPDLIFLDIQLPDGSGLDFLDDIQTHEPDLDAVVMTGLDDMSFAVRAMRGGAYDFLPKPVDVEDLRVLLDRWEAERRDRSGAAVRPTGGEPNLNVDRLIGRNAGMLDAFKLIGLAARTSSPVLIRGETGTGKEVIARAIHRHQHPDDPFVAVNCASLPDTLLEAELFGHTKGAFTGAVSARKGRFELAGTGTIFLDEIGDTSPGFQAKILRVVEERKFTPLGAEETRPMRARIVAATHRPLEQLAESDDFRSDLLYRLRVIEITLPPLRERTEDIPLIAEHLLRRIALRLSREVHPIPERVMGVLVRHSWPGNVRELENAITRAVALATGRTITVEGLGIHAEPDPGASMELDPRGKARETIAIPVDCTLDEAVEHHVRAVLAAAGGNKREAARRLGISPSRIYRLLQDDPDV